MPRSRGRVLIVEDEAYVRQSLLDVLAARGFDPAAAASVTEALSLLATTPVDVVLSDLRMPGGDGLELLRRVRTMSAETPILILTGHGDVAAAVACLKAGASDFILKPIDPEGLELALERALEARSLRREVRYLRSTAAPAAAPPIGVSVAWRRILTMVERAAPTDCTVLLLGESGTGKEVLARQVHRLSPRSAQPFVAVNCAAIPMEMWESEFFGHRKGAFTGAGADREGRFQLAHRGTLLLDEIGAMPAAGQAKLLRVIQDGEFDRLGDTQPTRVDVRIVASTNSDLAADAQAGRFRADLYHRLNVVKIEIPPLRERPEDIPVLLAAFAAEAASRLGRVIPDVSPAALARLRAYAWPGNARELKAVIERALVLDPRGLEGVDVAPLPEGAAIAESELNIRDAVTRLEKDLIVEARRRAGGIQKEAARLLGIDPRNLGYYLRKHGIADDEAPPV
jgi:two-component system response regulator AtoC